MIRPFSARQLHLVAGDGMVEAFAVIGDHGVGPSVAVHLPTLRRRMRDLARHIRTVVFFDEPIPDGALVALIDDMVEEFTESTHDVLAVGAPVTEAVKWVEDGFILHEVDRSSLVTVRCPEVVRRDALDDALDGAGDEMWVNPTELVVAAGGMLRIFEPASRHPVS